MNAVTMAAHLKSKALSPVEVIEAVLSRMERLEPHLHAFCTPTPELARAEAKRAEAEIIAGTSHVKRWPGRQAMSEIRQAAAGMAGAITDREQRGPLGLGLFMPNCSNAY